MTGARILAIDDEPQIRRALRRTLESQAYDVRTAGTGEDRLSALAWHPDVVLLDLMLPDMDGLEIARRIRAQSNVPIIVLSARGDDEQKVRALDAGCDDYITKPFSTDEMLARIRVALRHAAGHGTVPVMNAYSAATSARTIILYPMTATIARTTSPAIICTAGQCSASPSASAVPARVKMSSNNLSVLMAGHPDHSRSGAIRKS